MNATVEMLGQEIGAERAARRVLQGEMGKVKEQAEGEINVMKAEREELKGRVAGLEEEVKSRVEMLEYNIRKGGEDRLQHRLAL